jgi:hypothetical protein
MTLFRLHDNVLSVSNACLSLSVPTAGRYSDQPFWAPPVQSVISNWRSIITLTATLDADFGDPIIDTLPFRSYLLYHYNHYAAVSLSERELSAKNELGYGFAENGSFAFQNESVLLMGGDSGLLLGQELAEIRQEWQTHRKTLADYRYSSPLDKTMSINFLPGFGSRLQVDNAELP